MTGRINMSRENERLLALNGLVRKFKKIDRNKEASKVSQGNRKISGKPYETSGVKLAGLYDSHASKFNLL